jgi:hypothetical protein
MLNAFYELPTDTSEADVQFSFAGLVASIAVYLRVLLFSRSETKIIIGGILARYEYDVRSKCDPHFCNADGFHLIATEVKTHRTFAPGDMWYHNSRGIQVLTALYRFNCPTFLLSQKQWKLFVENNERNAILTFPYNDEANHTPHVNSSLIQPTGTTLLKAIVICLLSRRDSLPESKKGKSVKEQFQVMKTPERAITKRKMWDSPEKQPRRKSARIQKSAGPSNEKKQASFISGYIDGKPVYKTVRVLSPEVVSIIEDEIILQEKAELNRQASDATLCE